MEKRCLTRVDISFYPDLLNDRLRFGEPVCWRRLDRRRSIAGFMPNQIFSYVRWRMGDYGTREWTLTVCRAGVPGEPLQILPGVRPGAEVLLTVSGKTKVKRMLQFIDGLEAASIEPHRVSPSYWRVISNRLHVRLPLKILSHDRYAAPQKFVRFAQV